MGSVFVACILYQEGGCPRGQGWERNDEDAPAPAFVQRKITKAVPSMDSSRPVLMAALINYRLVKLTYVFLN